MPVAAEDRPPVPVRHDMAGAGPGAFRPLTSGHVALTGVNRWQLYDGADYSIQLRSRTAWGNLGPIQTLSTPGPARL